MDVSFLAPWAEGAVRKDKDRRDESGMTIKYNKYVGVHSFILQHT